MSRAATARGPFARTRRLENLPTPLHVVACDLRSAEVRLTEGPLVDAVLASAAIPGVFPPVDWNGRLLMDGGVIDNTPLSHAIELGAHEIYVHRSMHADRSPAPRAGHAGRRHEPPRRAALRSGGDHVRARAGLTILPPPCPIDVHPMDFGRPAELMARAEARARVFLQERSADVVALHDHRPNRQPGLAASDEMPSAG